MFFFFSPSLSNVHISAHFGPDGLLKSVTTLSDSVRTSCRLEFVRYGTRHSGDKSGAYLFLPDGPGRVSAVSKSPVRVVEGRLRAYVEVRQGWNTHRATLLNSPGVDGTSVLVSTRSWLINKMQDKNVNVKVFIKTILETPIVIVDRKIQYLALSGCLFFT
jgi:hypothetical protein